MEYFASHLDRCDLSGILTLNSNFHVAAERLSGAFETFRLDKASTGRIIENVKGIFWYLLKN